MTVSVALTDILSRDTLARTDALAGDFAGGDPFKHVVIDDFLDTEYCQALLEAFPPFDEKRALNEDGKVGRKSTHEQLQELGEPYRQLDRIIQQPDFLEWLGHVTGIPDLLYDPHYFGGGTHHNRHGQDLDPHVDFNRHPVTGWHRRLNLIVYLNHEWEPEWGGAIEFHKDPRLPPDQNPIKYVQPLFNRAVIFETTRWSWHAFDRINLPDGDADSHSRKSIALYFYSEHRPEHERAKSHSTIYVERPLPPHIRPGLTLSDADFQRVQVLIHRRDQHLQRLYRYISDLSEQVQELTCRTRTAESEVAVLNERVAEMRARLESGFLARLRRWAGRIKRGLG